MIPVRHPAFRGASKLMDGWQRSLNNLILVSFFKNFRGQASEIGGGHQDLLVVEYLAQKIDAARQIKFTKHVVEQQNGFFTSNAMHIRQLREYGCPCDGALLSTFATP